MYDAKCGLQREVRQQIKFVLLWKRDCEYDDERPYFKPTHISVSHKNLGSLNVQPWSLTHHNSYRHGPSTSRALPNHKKKRIVVYTTRFVHQRSFVLPILLYGLKTDLNARMFPRRDRNTGPKCYSNTAAILTLGLELSPLSLHHQNANVPAQEYNK